MQPSKSLRQQTLQSIIQFCCSSEDIRALALTGSSARSDQPADEWSDIDLVLVARNAEDYLKSTKWLNAISDPWITTVERDDKGNISELRVLFRSGIDVDFLVLACDQLQFLKVEPLSSILDRGIHIFVDKDGISPYFSPASRKNIPVHTPSREEFLEIVNDFWFHTVWTVKKMKRGELWTAKSCCDNYMKHLLLTMIEWHTHTREGWDKETWYKGRFIEHWASPDVLDRLPGIFAHYDQEDIWRALLNTMSLFDQTARETAGRLMYAYPNNVAQSITNWVTSVR
jgi:aminoglycoside 6-adenylyltransferase